MTSMSLSESSHVLQGDLTKRESHIQDLLDTDHDGMMSPREMRRGIVTMIEAMDRQNLTYDLDGNGTVDRDDLRLLIPVVSS